MSKRNQIPGLCVRLSSNSRMYRDFYNHKYRYWNARPILNNTVNSHETRNSNARVYLVLRSRSISLKQKRYRKENAEHRVKIGPFFSFFYNFSSLVNKTVLQRVFLFVFLSFYDVDISFINVSSTLFSMALMFYQRPFDHPCNDNQILPAKLSHILTHFNFKSWHL